MIWKCWNKPFHSIHSNFYYSFVIKAKVYSQAVIVSTLTATGVIPVEIAEHPGCVLQDAGDLGSDPFSTCRDLHPYLLPHCSGLWGVFWGVLLLLASTDTVPLCIYFYFALGYISL